MRDSPTTSRGFVEEAKRIAWRRTAPVDVLLALVRKFRGKEPKIGPSGSTETLGDPS